MSRLIAIGDIHGCLNTLKELLDDEDLKLSKNDTLVFLGDYIDRGKYSCQVIEFLIQLQKEYNVVCLRGNHEQMMIGEDELLWKYNGGNKTISSYHRENKAKLINIHKNWIRKLPLFYETEKFIFCHAGLPKVKLSDNTEEDLLWSRDWIETLVDKNEKQVVFGHTPNVTAEPYKTKNGNFCIDTACVYGGFLTALIIDGEDRYILSIPKHELD